MKYCFKIDTLSRALKEVALAQALVHDPKILILDEPTDGLDPIKNMRLEN